MSPHLLTGSFLSFLLLSGCGGPDTAAGSSDEDGDRIEAAGQAHPTVEADRQEPSGEASAATGAQNRRTPQEKAQATVINGHALDDATIRALRQHGIQVVPGRFWYDPVSGAFGPEGGPTAGFTMPGLQIGGPLRPDASGGGTGVYVNGRELHPQEVRGLSALLGQIQPGRYWMDHMGNYGVENGPPLGNLVMVLQETGAGGNAYIRETYGGYIGGDGQTSYYFDSSTGCSVISGGGVSC